MDSVRGAGLGTRRSHSKRSPRASPATGPQHPLKLQFHRQQIPRKISAMNDDETRHRTFLRTIALAAGLSIALQWMAQPPWGLWPLAMIALVPLVYLVKRPQSIPKRGYLLIWAIATVYWLLSLQGLRHAHWAMYFCWVALASYLAMYLLVFLVAARWLVAHRFPLFLAVAIAWTGQECLRGYILTGISACMLGHTLADVPILIQIADLFGTYGVSFVLAVVNVALFQIAMAIRARSLGEGFSLDVAAAATLLGASLLYGRITLERPLGKSLGTFALVQRSEPVEYAQAIGREVEMFRSYANDSILAIRNASEPVVAIVWPESMFTGGNPWMIADEDAAAPPSVAPQAPSMTAEDLQRGSARAASTSCNAQGYLLDAFRAEQPNRPAPHLIVGSGVVHYRQTPEVYCGVISIRPDGTVEDWYGKTHLVMFGEYVPILPHIPLLRSLVPPELGLKTGPGPKRFELGDVSVSPNVCIETAVERVTVNQLRELNRDGGAADVIVTITNDGWFDNSSVIDHHRRCAQLVAVGCRRPILSAANNGPTVWIDSRGQIREQLETGSSGVLFATPQQDRRASLYVRIGDWPARICALITLFALAAAWRQNRNKAVRTQDLP